MGPLKEISGLQGGGVFIIPDGEMEFNLSWGLGMETNNIEESLALWQGLQITRTQGINEIIVLGDSRVIIQALSENTLPSQMHLRQMMRKIQALVSSFRKIEYFHILRKFNGKADRAENIGSTLGCGILRCNGSNSFCHLP